MTDVDVLIVGAGPTGLVLALWLTKQGVKIRIIDKATQAATSTRALAVQARTLELYGQMGLADAVLEKSCTVTGINMWVRGRRAAHIQVTDAGKGMTAYPFVSVFPQHEHEQMLAAKLQEFGISAELGTELVSFTDDDSVDHVVAQLRKENGQEEICKAKYIAGCDGARSAVRHQLDVTFSGGTYDHVFYVADVEGSGAAINGELNVCLDQSDFLAVFPLAGEGRARLVGTIREGEAIAEARGEEFAFDHVNGRAIEQMKLKVEKVNWFSKHHVHHRVAAQFQRGRAFLLGDAAHVHSPVGGQGMNTGIGDAINLAWKLAAVTSGNAEPTLLETYAEERMRFARELVASTDRVFTLATADGWFAKFMRTRIVPILAPIVTSFRFIRNMIFRGVSQIDLNYRGMTLSWGTAKGPQPGERLPWVQVAEDESNFESLSEIKWHMHVYGTADDAIEAWCRKANIQLTVFEWSPACKAAHLVRNAIYLMRPDTYIALVEPRANLSSVESYLAEHKIQPN
ncbi:hypothetical protein K4F52_008827 [Lecanicillium sp. MT-2017a]|nr:hypothetical protein K4F52_008827 [Lecanicillium sp. MT-2017a]